MKELVAEVERNFQAPTALYDPALRSLLALKKSKKQPNVKN